jgi:hypothetical protein
MLKQHLISDDGIERRLQKAAQLLHNLHSSMNTIGVIKLMVVRRTDHVVRLERWQMDTKSYSKNQKLRAHLGNLGATWRITLKWFL